MRTKTFAAASLLAVAALVASSYVGPAQAGSWAIWAVVCASILVFAWGYPRLVGLPAPLPLSAVIALAGIGAATAATVAPMPSPLQWMGAFGAVGVILVFVTQLLRGTGQRQRLESTLGGCAGVLLVVFGSGWVAADRLAPNATNGSMMLLSGLSIAAAVLVSAIPWPERLTAPLGLLAAILVGGVASVLVVDVPVIPAVVVGAVVGSVVVCFHVLLVSEAQVLRGGSFSSAAPGVPGAPTEVSAEAVGDPASTLREVTMQPSAAGSGVLGIWGAISVGVASVIASGALVYYVERMLLH